MLTVSKIHQKLWPVVISIILTLLAWLISKWYYQDWFNNYYKYVAKAASLTATMLMCWCVVLSTRWRFIEDFYSGLDKVYQIHKRLGRFAFLVILLHPLFLAMDKLPDAMSFIQAMWFRLPGGDRYLWGQNVGVAAFILMTLLTVVTLWWKIPYHLWKKTHEWFGLVIILVSVHIVVVKKDVTAYPVVAAIVYGSLTLAVLSFFYIRFFYHRFGPHFPYEVAGIKPIGNILDITFTPLREKMDFKPSQFVYMVVHNKGITPEPHPYSIACGYNLDARFKLGIKKIGDHSQTLEILQKGDWVTVYGPYGHFSDKFLLADRDCVFVGAGIGVTPFLGMWHVALHSEERLDGEGLPEVLHHFHPEIFKTWKSPLVYLFYVCRSEEEAAFDDDIRNEVILSHFHGFQSFTKRGHHYELYKSSEKGRISGSYIDQQVKGGLLDKYIFICGPIAMVADLVRQLQQLGVPGKHIIIEDFNLY